MKLNREQIIKALECCRSREDNCDHCPLDKLNSIDCRRILHSLSLSLIKELNEEAQTYKKHHDIMDVECSRLEKRNDELTEENERLRAEGEWISHELGEYIYAFYCSECGWVDGYPFNDRHKYCPNCGAKMKGE